MSRTAIITDTDASLPADLVARYSIAQVPISVQFGAEIIESDIDIDNATLFARVDRENKLPTTSAPPPGKFAQAYQAAIDENAESIVCLTVSSEVSASYNAARVARDMFPDHDITVIDSRMLAMGQGFMVLAAAEAAEAGASKGEVIARAQSVGERAHLYAALSTIKYLAMSGRVGHLAAGMATVLSIKPILAIRDGKLDLLERVRSQKKAIARVIELTREELGARRPERLAILHVDAFEAARLFEEQLRAAVPCPDNVLMTQLNPGLSVHSGAGLVGAAFVTAE